MAKGRVKKTVKQSISSPQSNINGDVPKDLQKEDAFSDQEVERQITAARAIRNLEIEHLLTGLRLLHGNFSKEQLEMPLLQFFKENLPSLSIFKNEKNGQFKVEWKDKDGELSLKDDDVKNTYASLLHRISIAYPNRAARMPAFDGFEISSKEVKTDLMGGDNREVTGETSDIQMLGIQDAFRTPEVGGHRLSKGVTPKTVRLPKNGEMLLSVRGSPLGIYKEDNMEAIHESEEG